MKGSTGLRKSEIVSETTEKDKRVLFAEGDTHIWRDFVREQIPKLYGLFINKWPNPTLAEELVEKTIFNAVRGRLSYDCDKGSPEEWIFGIAYNNIRIEIRKRAAGPKVDGDLRSYLDVIDTKLLPDEILEQKETSNVIRLALNKLESKEQNVLKAKYIEGLSAKQISGQMNVSEKAVHSLLYRARNSLRDKLKNING